MSHFREVFNDVVASCAGSAACVYAGQPFDTVKVRMQVDPAKYSSTIQCLRRTVKNESVLALWRGSVPAFMGALSENAVAFAINGVLRRIINTDNDGSSAVSYTKPILTGAITGFCTSFVLCPCDVIKCRAQIDTAAVKHPHLHTHVHSSSHPATAAKAAAEEASIRSIASHLVKKHGIKGLYMGFSAQMLRDVPFGAAFFGSYEIFCQLFKRHTSLTDSTIYFMSGGFAGQLAWAINIPADTIKSAIQTSENPQSIAVTAKDIIRKRGWRGLFIGVEVSIIRAFPANAALFLVYEWSKKILS